MENINEESVSHINNLIRINTDRIDGYEKLGREIESNDLQTLFGRIADDSRKYRGELISEVIRIGGIPTEGNTLSGKFFKAWMDIKTALSNRDEKVIINLCEFGEDAALDAYENVLKKTDLLQHSRNLINAQKEDIKKTHDHIKLLREGIKENQHL